ncbi:LacI family DNA-binding transcriptional regulator [Dactylosporangium siamense]|uniref:LacI family transcriptional regulator n=1 Tax=Dactylosporangium siamense TaxID=685454 RepID=A0A919PSE7_9ACTN|nr:LacI family DNA-binding transcriptional regulator [Dactylosporangium siamense]GIG49357.1 LacI family transcriptional regulator [Dactylosporangium siamense]
MSSRPSLAQVAALSGVSVKTASRALSGEGYVAVETKARVQSAADELGYRLNRTARELRRGGNTSTLVGLLSGDLANPFYSRLASGLERELRMHGLQLITASTDENPEWERRLTDSLLERRVRGLVVASTMAEHGHLAAERRHGSPFVFVDRPPVDLTADAVLLDNRGGAKRAAEHLLERGHRRIGIVGDLSRLSTHQDRVEGFAEAMEAAGVADWRDYLLEDAHDVDKAERAVRALLARDPAPTALFTTNNRITTGALRAIGHTPFAATNKDAATHRDTATHRNAATDKDAATGNSAAGNSAAGKGTALIGFDELDLGDVLGVSVIAHDPEEMGRHAARLLLARLDGDDGPARRVVLPTRLIERSTTALT